ncbi:hypothetical protein DENSPDRAFT_884280 [Dentipellis sp. KUC8613]|nr:hypothetical protein DENSPDRAFT_884280 [Dentipellis sp. KUC8613]
MGLGPCRVANSTAQPVNTSYPYVSALLERGIFVLLYVGDYDWICNWVGSERWTLALEWSGQKEFQAQALRAWTVDGEAAGVTRKAGRLTFATVKGAGHMVPFDKPKQSLALINRWIAKEDLRFETVVFLPTFARDPNISPRNVFLFLGNAIGKYDYRPCWMGPSSRSLI